jgi:hypothetical protein
MLAGKREDSQMHCNARLQTRRILDPNSIMLAFACWLVHSGTPLPHAYLSPDVELVAAGCANLSRHIENTRKYGVPVVVAINAFASDSTSENIRCSTWQDDCYSNRAVHACVIIQHPTNAGPLAQLTRYCLPWPVLLPASVSFLLGVRCDVVACAHHVTPLLLVSVSLQLQRS